MLIFRGATALSSFRIAKLLTAAKKVVPAVEALEAQFYYFIELEQTLAEAELTTLATLLAGEL
ncbi:MAG: hypothetical protein FD130_1041, partial [Halothiobacillaceae bacterium]